AFVQPQVLPGVAAPLPLRREDQRPAGRRVRVPPRGAAARAAAPVRAQTGSGLMVGATAGCVWGWLRPSRVDVPTAGQAGCLAKAGAAARRRACATIQTCTVVAPTI